MIWAILSIILFILLVLITRVYLTANLIYTTDHHWLELQIHVLHICLFRKKIPLDPNSSQDASSNVSFSKMRGILKNEFYIFKELGKSAKKVLNRMHFHKLVWHTEGGTSEAGSTGLVAGGVWSIKGVIVCYLMQNSTMKCKPIIKVVPHFQQQCFYTRVECIASIRIGQAIHALVHTFRNTVIKGDISFHPKTEV
ncbi:DUF2953 domain-containing protein [Oceanobacillus manasiensis]|uniref:DUF2953 domain-containing protein n=1 Tax=Oceanobacillus manasiensis TaxID=586413 RepID=UPI000693C762|nr:DUF2953 domain-containing protein [Oceanobacillus manasiensis]